MYHGNLEIGQEELARVRAELDDQLLDRLIEERCRDPHMGERRILVVAHVTEREARFVVRDEGQGFNTESMVSHPTAEQFTSGQCRGITLIRSLMDELSFNAVGNELVMSKRAQTPSASLLKN